MLQTSGRRARQLGPCLGLFWWNYLHAPISDPFCPNPRGVIMKVSKAKRAQAQKRYCHMRTGLLQVPDVPRLVVSCCPLLFTLSFHLVKSSKYHSPLRGPAKRAYAYSSREVGTRSVLSLPPLLPSPAYDTLITLYCVHRASKMPLR